MSELCIFFLEATHYDYISSFIAYIAYIFFCCKLLYIFFFGKVGRKQNLVILYKVEM